MSRHLATATLLASAFALGLSCQNSAAAQAVVAPTPVAPLLSQNASANGFTISFSQDAVLTKADPGPDFDVYWVTLGDKTLVGIYAGNAPQFDSRDTDPNPLIKPRGDGSGRVDMSWRTGCDFPSRLHVFYNELSGQAELSKSIANSVRPAKCGN